MRKFSALMCCLAMSVAPLALAQTQKPPAAPATQPPVRVVVEMKQDPRTEACNSEAAAKNLRGEAREIFMTKCMK